MLARFYPTEGFVEVLLDLASAVALSLRRRRALAVVSRLALSMVLQLEQTQHFPIRVRTVVQACSMLPCLAQQDFDVGYQGRFRYDIRQAPECVPPSLRLPFACILGTPTFQDLCGVRGIHPRSSYVPGHRALDDSCRQYTLRLRLLHLQPMSDTKRLPWCQIGRLFGQLDSSKCQQQASKSGTPVRPSTKRS